MSKYAKQAVLAAASDDTGVKARLQDESTFEDAIASILKLEEEEKAELRSALANEGGDAVVEDVDDRETPAMISPGGGVTG